MTEAQTNGDAVQFSIIGERTVPETYADSVGYEAGPYGITLIFGKIQPAPSGFKGKAPSIPRFRVHMSPQHFKVMSLILQKLLHDYERQVGHVGIAPGLLESLNLQDTPPEEPA